MQIEPMATEIRMIFLFVGLFSKAIAQSGTNLDPWAQPAHEGVAPKRAELLASKFGCYSEADWSKTIDCLRTVPAENITAAFYEYFVGLISHDSITSHASQLRI